MLRRLKRKRIARVPVAVVDPIFWTRKGRLLGGGAALNNKESQCLKPERIIRRA